MDEFVDWWDDCRDKEWFERGGRDEDMDPEVALGGTFSIDEEDEDELLRDIMLGRDDGGGTFMYDWL